MKAGLSITAALAALAAIAPARAQDGVQMQGDAAGERLYSEKYSAIVQRLPFGPEPSGFDPDSLVTSSSAKGAEQPGSEEVQLAEEQNALATGVKVGIINVSLDGTAYVGFTDSTVNPPRNYYIRLGDTQGDWTVKGVDGDKREATLKKKDVEVTLRLGGGLGGSAADSIKASPEATGAAAAMRSGLASSGAKPQDGVSSARQKLAARRAQREADDAEAKAERAAAEARAAEAMARAEADRAAMREQLSALSESLRQEREERERREREEAEMRMQSDVQEEESSEE